MPRSKRFQVVVKEYLLETIADHAKELNTPESTLLGELILDGLVYRGLIEDKKVAEGRCMYFQPSPSGLVGIGTAGEERFKLSAEEETAFVESGKSLQLLQNLFDARFMQLDDGSFVETLPLTAADKLIEKKETADVLRSWGTKQSDAASLAGLSQQDLEDLQKLKQIRQLKAELGLN